MANQNGSNAYKMRYEYNSAEKRAVKKPAGREHEKRVRQNITVKLNKNQERRPLLAQRQLSGRFRSLDPAQVRVVFAMGFTFSVVAAYLVFGISCAVRSNELDHDIKASKAVLQALKSDYEALSLEKDKELSDASLFETAQNSLGMQKIENHQLNWFEVAWDSDFDD